MVDRDAEGMLRLIAPRLRAIASDPATLAQYASELRQHADVLDALRRHRAATREVPRVDDTQPLDPRKG